MFRKQTLELQRLYSGLTQAKQYLPIRPILIKVTLTTNRFIMLQGQFWSCILYGESKKYRACSNCPKCLKMVVILFRGKKWRNLMGKRVLNWSSGCMIRRRKSSHMPTPRRTLDPVPLWRRTLMVRFQRYLMPAIAALVVVALGITLLIFHHPASHPLVADDPTATPTDTATPTLVPTDTPLPTATPEPTDTPQPTDTPTPAPGKLVLQALEPSVVNCPDNPTGDPALDNWLSTTITLKNAGGRLVDWTVTGTTSNNIVIGKTGTVEPGGTSTLIDPSSMGPIGVQFTWSDHLTASGTLTAQTLCQATPTP
jgi:hypothetical protein